jgi:hypothetical protein
MGITLSDRDTFIGGHVTDEVKERIQEMARERRMSVSAFLSTILEKTIREEEFSNHVNRVTTKVHPVLPHVIEFEPPLPFED